MELRAKSWAMNQKHPQGPDAPEARRARQLRRAIKGDYQGASAAFAAFIGESAQRWNNVERGYPLSRQLAETLVRKVPGLTHDWLQNGNYRGLSVDLWEKLEAAADDSSAENTKTGR